jgi:hypothetical protein
MYITAKWVQAPSKDVGINLQVHRTAAAHAHDDRAWTIDDAERIATSPGPDDENLSWVQIPPRMNRVLAGLDIVFDERSGKLVDRVRRALEEHDLASDGWVAHDGVFVRFFLQPYLADRRERYDMLRANVEHLLDTRAELAA